MTDIMGIDYMAANLVSCVAFTKSPGCFALDRGLFSYKEAVSKDGRFGAWQVAEINVYNILNRDRTPHY